MTTLADAKYAAMAGTVGVTAGHINDMTLQWLQAKGATANQVNDAWRQFLDASVLAPTGQFNDDWFTYLGDQGHTGALNDREYAFWVSQAP